GGCNGNLKGICSLVKGLSCEEVKKRLSGIRCGLKPTSCPDQLTKAIDEALAAGAK
ncbi:MAG: TSCPD domain-containing protein, partial [Firmicutes bacterium]|nr:TSCPD domain-containing protein [Bacillota bacterium]